MVKGSPKPMRNIRSRKDFVTANCDTAYQIKLPSNCDEYNLI